nr:hypothetical protein [Bacteroidaceae bacterium]
MKKIYLLLATLFGLFISVSASAQDEQFPYGYDVDQPIVTDASQFYSPFSQNDLGNTDGGNLADGVLIDDDASSFWHSCWAATEGRQVPAGPHYLQIEIPDWVEEGTDLVLRFTRRNASNDHTTEWSICGTNDFVDYSTKDKCEELAYLLTPYGSNTETVTTEPFSTGGYKYIRLYSMAQTGANYGSRTYWHVSELNLYTIKPLTEWEAVNNELIAIADEYSYYLGTFELGDAPGQYSEEKYIAFE